MTIRTLIVDDHEMVRRGLVAYLTTQPDIEIVGEAASGREAVTLLTKTQPDIVLMDLVMEEMDGVEATREAGRVSPHTRVIVLTSYLNDDKLFPVLEAGAFSYILKTSRAGEIATAIRNAASGHATIEPRVSEKILHRMKTSATPALHEELTEREREVLALLGQAKTNQQIADTLFIGVKTVKTHVSNILSKLQLEDRTQAAVYAVENHLHQEKKDSPDV
ncbi:two component transcriptional regulator, LuxR family [Marininema mesophilum]|uniref:Two component transcriptional regulator, LuxR family n=1 Tax=Marininema mesophilum TaxID=1048340 RepID=A0A1H3B3Q6_9BACL|nr:response regulator transcription factor [Marininema mesophilum]SDX36650.1 two component transcriptional regulator, LuxR family [Marininema mesophilum]